MTKISISILSAALLTVSSAYAATMAANSGHAQNAADVGCFTKLNSGGVKNTCAAFKNWTIPLTNVRTSTGSVTVKATANGSCGAPGTVCLSAAPICTVEHINASGVLLQAATKTLSVNANATTTVGTLTNVTATSTLHMWCAMPGSDKSPQLGLMSVSW